MRGPWPGLTLWVALYVSDYALTIVCARMYRAQDQVILEGSFEITPAFQADVNALKVVSRRFLLALCVSTAALWLLWQLTLLPPGWPEAYPFALGALILPELVVHVRHLRNWFLFRKALGAGGVRGRLEYPRGIILRMSALEFLAFAGVFCVLYAATTSWFILGGTLACAVTAWRHLRLAQKQADSKATTD